jgi:hypothetical protein
MAKTDSSDLDFASYDLWRDKPLVSDLFRGKDSAILPVIDFRLRAPGVLGDVRAWLEERRIRRTAMEVLDTLFRRNRSHLKARELRVMASMDDLGLSILMLPPSGRIVHISGQDMDDFMGYCGGYLSPAGWLWTDLGRLKHLADMTTGNDRFVRAVMG